MTDPLQASINRYLACGLPIIPLAGRSKFPVVRGWVDNHYDASAFAGALETSNVGTRAGEQVDVDGKTGFLLVIDFDSPDVGVLRQLCAELSLPRTTCVRSGGRHRGYHLYYLTQFEVRKHGMLAYREASIDLLGKGSFAVMPPSIVERPYRFLIGLDEIAVLTKKAYDALVQKLSAWKLINRTLSHLAAGKLSPDQACSLLHEEIDAIDPDMAAYVQTTLDRIGDPSRKP